ncbi:M23 family metallopeptidase [Corticimicrobacter populi]|uniref:M23 family peptidase n=1 Tax=Corticimicrobacter populi TaxID=2175229 RepID=A0A2V1JYW8_9BURK|nr:M23 family metallopeptidase [Corticimicrobacter populi]PWF22976.1 M23 family peptidase [Corticimicrobacter populi]
MAFVILSARTLAKSKTRTLSVRFFLGLATSALLLALGLGMLIGWLWRPTLLEPIESVAEQAVSDQDAPEVVAAQDGRLLVERVGELSGRLVQLELEAQSLAARLGAAREFQERMQGSEQVEGGRVAKTQPGSPSGGPMLEPLPEAGQSDAEVIPSDPMQDESTQGGVAVPIDPGAGAVPDVAATLLRIQDDADRLSTLLAGLDAATTSLSLAHMSFPGRTPVSGFRMTSTFGNRTDPFRGRLAFHSGVDFPAPSGTPIHASAGGRVIYAGYRREYGHTVEIDHGAGLVTRYAHASRLLVSRGMAVMPGQEIARVGNSGRSTGPHLHFEILRDGRFVDPAVYLARF